MDFFKQIFNGTFFAPEKPDALTMTPLIAVLNSGVEPSGIGSPVRKQDNKQRGPIILQSQKYIFFDQVKF